jgi:hypothetical protein
LTLICEFEAIVGFATSVIPLVGEGVSDFVTVGVGVGVDVRVAVDVEVAVPVEVDVGVCVGVGVGVGVNVFVAAGSTVTSPAETVVVKGCT